MAPGGRACLLVKKNREDEGFTTWKLCPAWVSASSVDQNLTQDLSSQEAIASILAAGVRSHGSRWIYGWKPHHYSK